MFVVFLLGGGASCGAWEWLNYKEALILEAKYPLLFCVCVCVVFLQICFEGKNAQ
jgi:hypothetical protein